MGTTTKRHRPISHYWGLVKDMDDSQKLQLVTMLVNSVKPAKAEPKKQNRKPNIDDYYGMWADDEFMDAEVFVKFLHDSRMTNPRRDEFLEKFFTEP